MKRIAYLGVKGLPSRAGADRVVEAIVCGIDHKAYEPVVYCSRRAVPRGTTLPGVRLIRIASLPGKHLHATSLFLFAALHCLVLGRYDLVHLHNVEAAYVLPLLRLRYRVLTTSHGPAQARDKWGKLAKFLIRLTEYPFIYLSTAVTSVAKPLATYYQRMYGRPVHYIPNGVDDHLQIDANAAQTLLAQHQVEAGRYILFAAGRILATKGCHYLLEAFRALSTTDKLVIVGDTSHVPAYARQLAALADERVCFIPFVEDKAILLGLIKHARLFVFPSTVEAMSMMLLEAASVGSPIICSDIAENVAVLPNQALFFAAADSQDLQTKLEWALAHPMEMAARAQDAKNWVYEAFHWPDIIKQYEHLYHEVMAQRQGK